MGTKGQGRHLDDARLHAYVAGEADPAERAVVEAHVDACEHCREALGRVGAVVGLIRRVAPVEPDELSWRRMQARVRERLEADAESAGLATIDLFMGRRWVSAAVAAVAAVALLVWFAPRGERRAPDDRNAPEVAAVVPAAQTVTSGDAPMAVKLASGAELELAPKSRVVAPPPSSDGPDLELEMGELAVRLPDRPSDERPYRVRTPAFSTSAKSKDFTVGYRADGYLVDVRDGVVDVEGKAFGGTDRVKQGERREIRVPKAPARTPAKTAVTPKPARAPVEPLAKDEAVEPTEPVVRSSEGETSVQVLAPDDPVTAAWRAASRAYYRDRDLDAAIAHAEVVIRTGDRRAEVRLAKRLICDARIALEQPNQAVQACRELLDGEKRDEELRNIHYMLATIFRTQLSDCRRAVEHYEQVLVYGRTALLDDEARLFRAQCALALGDLQTAQADIRALAPHAARLSRPGELRALQKRLEEALAPQEESEDAEPK